MTSRDQDSYDALAVSIERLLRIDISAPNITKQLAVSIDRIMLEEARAGELRLAWVRLLVVAPYLLITLWAIVGHGATEPVGPVIPSLVLGTVWLAGAVALVIALRRGWYGRWVPRVTPFVHAAMILGGSFLWWGLDQAPWPVSRAENLGYVIVHAAFLSFSGALRLSRWSAHAGTALGVTVFLLASLVMGMSSYLIGAIALVLLATGLIASSVTALVRRVVTDEVARTTLGQMYEDAQSRIDAREQVLRMVSHDLRNPLNTISMTATLMLEVPVALEQQRVHLARIKRAGERMNRLIQDLLDVAKLEAGRAAIDAKPIHVAPLLREAYDMLAPLAAEKSIEMEASAKDGLPTITADAGRILQVLSNLVGNAIKFTPSGGRIIVRADHDPLGVRFSVRDTGPGIPPDHLTEIFAPLWQGNRADRRGIGLGLSIAKSIVEAHGGRIWCESPKAEGTTFHFTLGVDLPVTVSGVQERRR